jgi:acylglycerol lipase
MSWPQQNSFRTTDGLSIHTVSHLPAGTPRAGVLIVHGIGEHSARYAHVAAYLAARGYAVYSLDHRGHGHSDGLRAYFDSFDQPVNDLKQYFDQIRQQHPGLPLFVYGHSLGSLISLVFTLRYQDEMAGLMISGNPLRIETRFSPLLVQAVTMLQRFAPWLKVAPPVSPEDLSRDAAYVALTLQDPLAYQGYTRVRMAFYVGDQSRLVCARLGEIRLPLLILHGGGDKVCPPAGSELAYEQAGSADKTLKLYPGLYHEIHNEPEKETVFADVAAWLDART